MMALAIAIAVYGQPSSGVPHWIAYVACLAIFLGGITTTGIAFGVPQISSYLGPALVVCLAIIPTWIAFGPGERHCSGGLSFLGFTVTHGGGGTECRVVFGFAAVLIWVMFAAGAVQVFSKKNPTNSNPKDPKSPIK